MNRGSRCVWRWAGLLVSIGVLGLAATTRASAGTAVPPRGSEAPAFALESVHGDRVELAQFTGRPVVLIFGDLQHEGSIKAAREALGVLEDDRFEKLGIVPIFLTAEASPRDEMERLVSAGRFPAVVAHDPHREAFGAYQILVVPSVVVVNGEGVVVYAMPGFLPRFKDLLTESLLVSTGQMSDAAFEASLEEGNGNGKPAADPNALRAERLVHLGEQLLDHGMDDMAEARFREAVQLLPGFEPARLALGEQCRKRGEIEEAEGHFRAILDADPDSVAGALALARVQIDRGGDFLDTAEETVRGVLDRHPESARAHYQLGLILEARGDPWAAAASYREAAELLLER